MFSKSRQQYCPFIIALLKQANTARICWYRRPFRPIYRDQTEENITKKKKDKKKKKKEKKKREREKKKREDKTNNTSQLLHVYFEITGFIR